MYRILFVCAGNTCRSPLAEALLRRELGEEGRRIEVGSAGVSASSGTPATAVALAVAGAAGLDLHAHRARRLDRSLAESADLLLAMDAFVLEEVRRLAPVAAGRARLVGADAAASERGAEVPDPFGGSREAYEECLHRLGEHVRRLAPRVLDELRRRERAEAGGRGRKRG